MIFHFEIIGIVLSLYTRGQLTEMLVPLYMIDDDQLKY